MNLRVGWPAVLDTPAPLPSSWDLGRSGTGWLSPQCFCPKRSPPAVGIASGFSNPRLPPSTPPDAGGLPVGWRSLPSPLELVSSTLRSGTESSVDGLEEVLSLILDGYGEVVESVEEEKVVVVVLLLLLLLLFTSEDDVVGWSACFEVKVRSFLPVTVAAAVAAVPATAAAPAAA